MRYPRSTWRRCAVYLLLCTVGEFAMAAQVYSQQADRSAASPPVYGYGVGSVYAPQPASGIGWRHRAPLQYYSAPPAPTYRWFTTGHGCTYEPARKFGVGYPQQEYFGITNQYGRK